jgi:hypothetical protein
MAMKVPRHIVARIRRFEEVDGITVSRSTIFDQWNASRADKCLSHPTSPAEAKQACVVLRDCFVASLLA